MLTRIELDKRVSAPNSYILQIKKSIPRSEITLISLFLDELEFKLTDTTDGGSYIRKNKDIKGFSLVLDPNEKTLSFVRGAQVQTIYYLTDISDYEVFFNTLLDKIRYLWEATKEREQNV